MKQSSVKSLWPIFVIGLFGILPFLWAAQLNDPVRYPQLLMLGGLQLLVVGVALVRGGGKALRSLALPQTAWILVGSWLLLHGLALTQAVNLPEGLFETLQSSMLVGAFLLLSHFLQTEKSPWKLLAQVLTVAVGLQALLALLQWSGTSFPPGVPNMPPSGMQANPNQLAALLCLSLPLLIWGVLRLPKTWKIGGSIVIGMALVALFLTGSRSSWFILLVWAGLLPIYLLPRLWRNPAERKLFWRLAGICIFGVVGMFLLSKEVNRGKAGSYHYEYIWSPDVQIRPEHNSLEHRFIVWNKSVDLIQEYPLLGVGPGNWKVMIPKYGIKGFDDAGRYGMDYTLRPHNEFLQVAGELGVGGLLCFLLMLGGAFWLLMRGIRSKFHLEAFLLLLALVGMLWVLSFSFPRERPFSGLLMALYLALVVDLGWRAGLTKPKAFGKMPLGMVMAGVLLAALVVTGLRMRTDVDIRRMRDAKNAQNWSQVLRFAEDAVHPLVTIDPVSATPIAWYAGIAQLSTGKNVEGLKEMQLAAEVSPWHLAVRTNLAASFEMNGQHAEAAEAYRSLLQTFPDFEASWLNLAVVYLHMGKVDEVRKCLAKVSPDTTDPKYKALREALSGK